MTDITASEVIGELKRLVRTYEALDKAMRIVEVVADAEKKEREINTNIVSLKKKEAEVSESLETAYSELDNATASTQTAKEKAEKMVADASKEATRIINEASIRAKGLVTEAYGTIDSLEASIKDATTREKQAITSTATAEAELLSLQQSIKIEKQRIIESLK